MGNKNKKKSGFMATAKKFGDQGQFGRGEQLSYHEYNYFIEITNNIKVSQGEEKDDKIRCFFNEFTSENGSRFVRNQVVSRMLDTLLPQAKVESLLNVVNVLSEDLFTFCTDPYSSHVVQTTILVTLKLIQDDVTQEHFDDDGKLITVAVTEEQSTKLTEFILKVSKYCCNNLLDFISDKYASHVVRTVLEVCSGYQSTSRTTGHQLPLNKQKDDTIKKITVPAEVKNMIPLIAERFKMVPNLPDVISTECGSAAFQCVLKVSSQEVREPLCQHVLSHGLRQTNTNTSEEEDDANIPAVFNFNSTARLFESVINSCSQSVLEEIYDEFIKDNIDALVKHNSGFYSIQRLLEAWKEQGTFQMVSNEVRDTIPAALEFKHTSVIMAWVSACKRLQSEQGSCFTTIMKSFDCHEPEERQLQFVPALVQMVQHDSIKPQGKVNLHGSLIVQDLLHFCKPIKVINSILAMPTPDLVWLLQDPRGCHITDAFGNSPFVGEKSKAKLVAKLQNEAVSLACSKHGSRSLDALWLMAKSPAWVVMCQHFVDNVSKLKSNEFGSITYAKYDITLFSKNKNGWIAVAEKKDKKRKLVASIKDITREPGSKKRKKGTPSES